MALKAAPSASANALPTIMLWQCFLGCRFKELCRQHSSVVRPAWQEQQIRGTVESLRPTEALNLEKVDSLAPA